MADTSVPWTGSTMSEAQWYKSLGSSMLSGVIGEPADQSTFGPLGWSNSGLTITLLAGSANVGGGFYDHAPTLASVSATANAHSTFSRRDRLVLRRDLSTHTVTPVIIAGTPAATPNAPAAVQSSTQYDLSLFTFVVPPANGTNLSGIVDQRVWIGPQYPDRLLVFTMANRPTSGMAVGQEIVDTSVGRSWRYDGTYWRDAASGQYVPGGATGGDYITTIYGSTVVNVVGTGGQATITLPRTYDGLPLALVTIGSISGNIASAAFYDSLSDGNTLKVVCRQFDGSFVTNGTPVRINWQCIGYND